MQVMHHSNSEKFKGNKNKGNENYYPSDDIEIVDDAGQFYQHLHIMLLQWLAQA